MIDPKNITNYNRNLSELQEFLLFAICVAGKKSSQIAPKINAFVQEARDNFRNPFDHIRHLVRWGDLESTLYRHKLGKYDVLTKAFQQILPLNLLTCTVDDLESCHGIGPKTARFFLLHSRPKQKLVVLDTHLLKWVRENIDPNAPKQTPTGNRYKEIEQEVLSTLRADDWASFDLGVWASYAK